MTVGSLFTGIGGFDLGFINAGCKIIWQCEKDIHCRKLLTSKFPDTKIYWDVKDLVETKDSYFSTQLVPASPDIIIGGDPCPAHSNAKGSNKSIHPDLSGYFLAVVGRLTPKWVVRENVPSPVTVDWFSVALEALGYSTIIVESNAKDFVPQNRKRFFVIGCSSQSAIKNISKSFSSKRPSTQSMQIQQISACLSASSDESLFDNYVYEHERGIRKLAVEEREFFAGFPSKYTSGISDSFRCRMYGNAVVPQVAEAIAVEIVRSSKNIRWSSLDTENGIRKIKSYSLI